MIADLKDAIGERGEAIVVVCLTDFSAFARPLFRLGFLGAKWPSIDYYVELRGVRGASPYFFAQTKTTARRIASKAKSLSISAKSRDIERLLRYPGPTFLLGVHEPSKRVFIRSVHDGIPASAITRIPLANELTPSNLRLLYREVRAFWKTNGVKPSGSVFK